MTDMRPASAAMAELIAKLEAAERGSLDLTADIYEALGFEVIRRPRHPAGIAWRFRDPRRDGARWERMQDLSESLDAALSLIPEGWEGEVSIGLSFAPHGCRLTLLPNRQKVEGYGQTSPLALDIAALRARSAS